MLALLIVPVGGIRTLAVVLAVLAFGGWYFGEPWTFHLVSIRQASFLSGVLVFSAGLNIKRFGFIVPIAIGFAVLALFLSFNFDPLRPVAMMFILAGTVNLQLPWERRPARWLPRMDRQRPAIHLMTGVSSCGTRWF